MWGEGNIDRRRRGRPIPKLKLRGGCGVASIKEREVVLANLSTINRLAASVFWGGTTDICAELGEEKESKPLLWNRKKGMRGD